MRPHFSAAVEFHPFVFVSGQLGFDDSGRITGDVEAQTTRTIERIARTLGDAGLGLADVVKTTIWLTRASDFEAFDRAYARSFGDHRPARSTIIAGLVLPGALVEIEALAGRSPTCNR